jgi:two-component system, NarL family, invasion response regulator UvrY
MSKHSIAIVDDHQLVANAIAGLIGRLDDYEVIFEAENGQEMIKKISLNIVPAIILLDINMPVMDGYETATWLKNNYPEVKVLALSMNNAEDSIIKMLKNGARGYLLKDCRPSELKHALDELILKGYHYTDFITDKLVRSLNLNTYKNEAEALGLNGREMAFLELACSDLTYNEIADKMCVSPRTIDGYRESVFVKLNVKTRVSMAMEAIKLRIVAV